MNTQVWPNTTLSEKLHRTTNIQTIKEQLWIVRPIFALLETHYNFITPALIQILRRKYKHTTTTMDLCRKPLYTFQFQTKQNCQVALELSKLSVLNFGILGKPSKKF